MKNWIIVFADRIIKSINNLANLSKVDYTSQKHYFEHIMFRIHSYKTFFSKSP